MVWFEKWLVILCFKWDMNSSLLFLRPSSPLQPSPRTFSLWKVCCTTSCLICLKLTQMGSHCRYMKPLPDAKGFTLWVWMRLKGQNTDKHSSLMSRYHNGLRIHCWLILYKLHILHFYVQCFAFYGRGIIPRSVVLIFVVFSCLWKSAVGGGSNEKRNQMKFIEIKVRTITLAILSEIRIFFFSI